MEIRIKNEVYNVRKTFRAVMIWEKLTGRVFDVKNTTDMLVLFYSCYMAAPNAQPMAFDEFITLIDLDSSMLDAFNKMIRVEYAVSEQFSAEKSVKGKNVKKKG